MSDQQTEIRTLSAKETINLAFDRAKVANEAKTDKDWRKAYAYYLSAVRMFMKALPAYKSNEKKKEKNMLTMEISKLMDEATAMKKEAAVTFDITQRSGSVSALTGLDEEWFAEDECKIAPALFKHDLVSFEANSGMHTRDRVVLEIFTTEQTYLANIKCLFEHFLMPLTRAKGVSFIGRQYTVLNKKEQTVLQNVRIEPMIRLHEKVLQEIESRVHNWGPDQTIGDIFHRYAPFFKCYVEYASRFDELSKTIQHLQATNKSVQKLLSRREQDIDSLMICPIQRIPRYKLLLQELLKTTNRKYPGGQHRDCEHIPLALEKISGTANFVNASIAQYQHRLQLLAIQNTLRPKQDLAIPGRKLLKNGDVVHIQIGQPTAEIQPVKARLFLLNDILIPTVPTRQKFSSKSYNRCLGPNVKPTSVEAVPSDFLVQRLAWPTWQQIFPLLTQDQSLTTLAQKVRAAKMSSRASATASPGQKGADLCIRIRTWMDGEYSGGWKEGVGPHGYGRWKKQFEIAASSHPEGDAPTTPKRYFDSYVGGWVDGQRDTRLPGIPHLPGVDIKHSQDPETSDVVSVRRVGEWRENNIITSSSSTVTKQTTACKADDGAHIDPGKLPEAIKKASPVTPPSDTAKPPPVEQELEDLEGMLFGSDETDDEMVSKAPTKAPMVADKGEGVDSNPDQWGCSEVAAFVQALGKGGIWTQCKAKMLENDIDGATLLAAELDDLTALGISRIHARRILRAVRVLQPPVQYKPASELLERCEELCQTDRQAAASIRRMQELLESEFGQAAFEQHRTEVISRLRSHIVRKRSLSSPRQPPMKEIKDATGSDKVEPSASAPVLAVVDVEKLPNVFYAVAKGHLPGIYLTEEACRKQVFGFADSLFKKFESFEDARQFVVCNSMDPISNPVSSTSSSEELVFAFEVSPLEEICSLPSKRSIYICKSAEERDTWIEAIRKMIQDRISRNRDLYKRRATLSKPDIKELMTVMDPTEVS